jgi:hypothetical protein
MPSFWAKTPNYQNLDLCVFQLTKVGGRGGDAGIGTYLMHVYCDSAAIYDSICLHDSRVK